MKIRFLKEKRLFILSNKAISYVMHLNEKKILMHLYYGERLEDEDYSSLYPREESWSKNYFDKDEKVEKVYEDFYHGQSGVEISSFGDYDLRGETIKLRQKDNSFYTDLRYKSHKIYNGLPTLKKLPCAHGIGQSIEFCLVDSLSQTKVYLTYSILEDNPFILRTTVIEGKTNVSIETANSITLDLFSDRYDLIHFPGDWCRERFLSRVSLDQGTFSFGSSKGRSSHEDNPFFMVCEKNASEDKGRVYGFNFIYSGSFVASATMNKFNDTRINLGISNKEFSYPLSKGERFELPQAIIAYSSNGFNGISHAMHDFVRNNIINYERAPKLRPITFNSWEGCYLDFDTQSQLDYISAAKAIGSELYVLDDGWFGDKRDKDDNSLGDWYPNEKKIDPKKIIDHCHNLGMKFGLWFEPEMINFDSNLARKHPEYILGHPNLDISLSRHQLYVDLTNDKAIEEIANQVNKILDEYDIDYVKWDHNRELCDSYSQTLDKKYQGAVEYLLTLGVYKLFDKIVSTHPNIFFQGCASGGGRFDLGVLAYFPEIWTSDETDAITRLFIQQGTSYGYPLSTMASHISKQPSTSYKMKSDVAFFGTYGFEFNPTLITKEDLDEVMINHELYKKHHEKVILNGDLYRLRSVFDSNIIAMQSVSKDKSESIVLIANLLKKPNTTDFLKLEGLDAKSKYINDFDKTVHTGKYLKEVGLNISSRRNGFKSDLIFIKKEN